MAITIRDLFNKINPEKTMFQLVTNTLMEVKRGSQNKPSSIRIGVPDEIATDLMGFGETKQVGMLIMIDREEFEQAKKNLGI